MRITFTDEALDAIAQYASMANELDENIGARRLHTILETLLEDVSYNAGGDFPMVDLSIDAAYVNNHLSPSIAGKDLKRYIV